MKKNCSNNFNVVFLNEKTIFDYWPELRKDINDLPIALKTDYIRKIKKLLEFSKVSNIFNSSKSLLLKLYIG